MASNEIKICLSVELARSSIELLRLLDNECQAEKVALYASWELHDKEFAARIERGWTAEDDKWEAEVETREIAKLEELEERSSRYKASINNIAAAHGIQLPQIRMYRVKEPLQPARNALATETAECKDPESAVKCDTVKAPSESSGNGIVVKENRACGESEQTEPDLPVENSVAENKSSIATPIAAQKAEVEQMPLTESNEEISEQLECKPTKMIQKMSSTCGMLLTESELHPVYKGAIGNPDHYHTPRYYYHRRRMKGDYQPICAAMKLLGFPV